MNLIADILLAAGALGAAFYCFTLGRRLKKFNDLEKGMGGAIATLSAQVDDLEKSVTSAQQAAVKSGEEISEVTARADDIRRKLELQIASLHDLPISPQSRTDPEQPSAKIAPQTPPVDNPASQAPGQAESDNAEPMFVRHRVGA